MKDPNPKDDRRPNEREIVAFAHLLLGHLIQSLAVPYTGKRIKGNGSTQPQKRINKDALYIKQHESNPKNYNRQKSAYYDWSHTDKTILDEAFSRSIQDITHALFVKLKITYLIYLYTRNITE